MYARLVQHGYLRVQQAPKVAISKGPHTGAARARNDHHAVAQGRHQRAPLQGPQLLTVGPWQALRRELFGATGWRTRPRNRAGLQAERGHKKKASTRLARATPGAVGLGHLSSAGHAHVVQPGPSHPSLEDEHLFRLLRNWHRLSLATTSGVPHGLGWTHTAREVRIGVTELVGQLQVHVLREALRRLADDLGAIGRSNVAAGGEDLGVVAFTLGRESRP